jgi:hypothetical protein
VVFSIASSRELENLPYFAFTFFFTVRNQFALDKWGEHPMSLADASAYGCVHELPKRQSLQRQTPKEAQGNIRDPIK